MRLREISAQDCPELIEKQEKLLCVIGRSDQSGIIQKTKNCQRLLNKIEIGYFLLQDVFREKLCLIDLPVPQCISLNDFTKKIDIFTGNWNRKLNICKQYNINLPKHELLQWNCTKIDSFNSAVNLCLASNLPAIPIPELFEHIIGFFQHSIQLQPFDFHMWKLTEKQHRSPPRCISIANCESKSLPIVEVKNFETELEIRKVAKEMNEKEHSVAIKNVQLQNPRLHQNAIFGLSDHKNTEVRNENGDKKFLNFHKSHLSSEKKTIDLAVFELVKVEKQLTDRIIFLSSSENLNGHQQFGNSSVRIQSQFIINKSNKNMKSVSYDEDDDDDNRSNSDERQCHNAEANMIMDMTSEPTKEDDIIDTCNVMYYSNNKKNYQNNDSNFPTDCLHNIKYTDKAIYSDADSESSLNTFNIKTFGSSNIHNEHALCKESWPTLLINFNIQTKAMHIEKLIPMFLYNSESIPYHLPTIYNKHIISCSPYRHGFSTEYKSQKSIALGNKAQLSDKSLISVHYTDGCSNFPAMTNNKELQLDSRMVTYKSTAPLHEESLHVSTLPNENRHMANIPDPSQSDSLKESLITAGLNSLNEEGRSCNASESKSQSFVSNDNNLSTSSCTEIASNQDKNAAHPSAAQMEASVPTEANSDCPQYRDFDYNCWTSTAQGSHLISPKRKQSSLCRDNMISAESESKSRNDLIPSQTRSEQDDDNPERIDALIVDEDEVYNEYKVIKKPRLQLREGRCFHKDPQCRICSDKKGQDSPDQIVPANDDQVSFPEESASLYNNCLDGNANHGAFCWNSSLLPNYSDMKDSSSQECPVVLPLTTCNKPLRMGLSKRQKLPPLHPQAKKRRCMLPPS